MTDGRPGSTEGHSVSTSSWAGLIASDETLELLVSARDHFAKLFPSSILLAIQDGEPLDSDAWDVLIEHGYSSLGLPEELGGLGSFSDATMLAEEAGRALLPLPLTTSIGAMQTALFALLPLPESPDPISLLLEEPGTDDVEHLSCVDGALARRVVSLKQEDDGVRLLLREVSTSEAQLPALDPSRPWGTVTLGATIAQSVVENSTVDHVLAPARTILSAELIGVAARALEGALDHATTRHQFGKPIGSFQGIKHMIADVHVALESARSLTYGAAAELTNSGLSDRAAHLSLLANALSAEVALRAAGLRTQLLGAMGLTAESDNHLAIRRCHQLAYALGTPSQLFAKAALLTISKVAKVD